MEIYHTGRLTDWLEGTFRKFDGSDVLMGMFVERNVGVGDFLIMSSIGVSDLRSDMSRLLPVPGIGILRKGLLDAGFMLSSLMGIGINASSKQCR